MNVVNINFLILYCALSFVNVVIQTVKSLCTVKCSTFISACVNAVAYGLYVYVIFYTNAEGLNLVSKAMITAIANFTGVYLANFLFKKMFKKEVSWAVNISVPIDTSEKFVERLNLFKLKFHCYGVNEDMEYVLFTVFCPTRNDSMMLKNILPVGSVYHISESIKRL